jgi:hypothetical protein
MVLVGFGLHTSLTRFPIYTGKKKEGLTNFFPRRKPFFLPSLLGKSKSLSHRGTNHDTNKKDG